MAVPLRQSYASLMFMKKHKFFLESLIDPLSVFSYNPAMLVSYFLVSGGFYRPDHDPPFYH